MKRLLALVALLVAAGSAGEAQAQWGWMGNPQWYGRNVYSVYDQDRLPYFALHPPVYYSRPVPRTYGYSPFAYPGDVMTPDLPVVEPEIIVNPYFDPAEPQAAPPAGGQAPQAAPPAQKPTGALRAAPLKRPGARVSADTDRSASVRPLRIVNPYAAPLRTVSR